jgi:short-subunit dehydrogenase
VPEQIKSALFRAEDVSGPVDMAILNAGIYTPVDVKNFSSETFVKQMQVNYFGIIHCLDYLLPAMLARGGGHLALMGSVAGYRGLPKSAAYGPTKAAIQNLAESLYFDLNPKGVKLQVINPGFVETEATAVNDFVMPDLISSDVAAAHVIQGLQEDIFEISFPKSFVRKLKFMRLLPSQVYLSLTSKLTGYR